MQVCHCVPHDCLFQSTTWLSDGVHVEFVELEDHASDPEGFNVNGEDSDEIIYHRSQAEAGCNRFLVFI
jgi:hypothetical protein